MREASSKQGRKPRSFWDSLLSNSSGDGGAGGTGFFTGTKLVWYAMAVFVFYVLSSRISYRSLTNNNNNSYSQLSGSYAYSETAHRMRTQYNSLKRASISCGTNLKGEECNRLVERVLSYCNDGPPLGQEGIFHGRANHPKDGFKLRYLTLTIRHGDRSTLNFIPGARVVGRDYFNDSLAQSRAFYDKAALLHAPKASNFQIVELYSQTDSGNSSVTPGHPALSALFNKPDTQLSPGQLTTKGFMQHVRLGQFLRAAYAPLVDSIVSRRDIYVRSTNYMRTIQSAVALVSSMLPHVGGPASSHQVEIEVYPDESMEIMHGVGLRLSSTAANGHGDSLHEGSCHKAFVDANRQREGFTTLPSVDSAVSQLFGREATQRPVTDLADAALPQVCHSEPMPCSASNGGCLSMHLMTALMSEADRYFCERYTGPSGGSAATKLSIQPLMAEILHNLQTAANELSSKVSEVQSLSKRIHVLSGHDTVIAPVLAALGVLSSQCLWPQYASRIAFELWEREKYTNTDDRWFVRVVFNGIDVTGMIPECIATENGQGIKEGYLKGSLGMQMCPLSAFAKQIGGLLGGFATLQEACK